MRPYLFIGIHNCYISDTVRVLATKGDIAKSRMLLLLWLCRCVCELESELLRKFSSTTRTTGFECTRLLYDRTTDSTVASLIGVPRRSIPRTTHHRRTTHLQCWHHFERSHFDPATGFQQQQKGRALSFVSRFPVESTAVIASSFVFFTSGREEGTGRCSWSYGWYWRCGRCTVHVLFIAIIFKNLIHCDQISVLYHGNEIFVPFHIFLAPFVCGNSCTIAIKSILDPHRTRDRPWRQSHVRPVHGKTFRSVLIWRIHRPSPSVNRVVDQW